MMEKLKGFMIMPFLSIEEKKEISEKGLKNCNEQIRKKKLCEDFYKKIIIPQCNILNIDIVRADDILKSQDIVENIIYNIEKSDIVLVDLTLFRPNVLYELGIAHHIDANQTLLITQEEFSDLPFDIKGFANLKYDSTDVDFADGLHEKLCGLVNYHYEIEICLGISPFPELFILIKELIDKKIKINVRPIQWHETFDHFFEGEKIDLVIANSELCHNKNKNKPTNYIYTIDLIHYNSFYLISKNPEFKSFNELKAQYLDNKECIKKTMEQFNFEDRKTVLYACEKTDHAVSFKKFNSLLGNNLIENIEIHANGTAKDILRDFIRNKDGDLYIGGIPERINLLKNPNYKLIIEFNDIKHDEDFAKIRNELQQRNGIVYHRLKEREIDNIDEIVKTIQQAWNDAYSKIVKCKNSNTELIDEYLSEYNNSEYVKTFKFRNIDLVINSKDFIENYIEDNLISIE